MVNTSNKASQRKEGEIDVNHIPEEQIFHKRENEGGEYIEFEEVK